MSGAKKKLLVLGGTGFVGSEICRKALLRNCEVVALSRRGQPGAELKGQAWANKVDWRAGSALDPVCVGALVPEVDAVVHSIGILLESRMNSFFSGSKSSGENVTYEQANRDSALIPAREALKSPRTKAFVFVSAKSAPPLLDRYLKAKREVEAELSAYNSEELRSVFLHPGFVFHPSKGYSLPLSSVMSLGESVSSSLKKTAGIEIPGLDAPTSLDLLADAAVVACLSEDVSGVLENQGMQDLVNSLEGV